MKDQLIEKKYTLPFILITCLFALWGFANAVTDPMVQAFKTVLELSNAQASWVQMAFYGGYFCMALPAALFVRKQGYKKGVLLGLALYFIGANLFIPAAQYEAFWFFCLGLYVLTFGLAFLETTANPYILAMGSKTTATRRLNFAQLFNPVGLILGLVIAQQFVLKNLQSDNIENYASLDIAQKALIRSADLMVIRDPYVAIGLVIALFFILILATKMPVIQSEQDRLELKKGFSELIKNKRYRFGVGAQVFYVGAQIMCWTYIYQYAENIGISNTTAANYQFIAFLLFFSGRALCTYLMKFIPSARLLSYFAVGGFLCSVMTMMNQSLLGMYCLIGISFFMSLMFPTIYGISLKKLDQDLSKIGAAGLVMAIVGGALMPQLQGRIIDFGGRAVNDIEVLGVSEVNFSFVLPALCFVYILAFGRFILKENEAS